MADFNRVESLQEFKLRLNSLTEKLDKINKTYDMPKIGDGAADNQRSSRKA